MLSKYPLYAPINLFYSFYVNYVVAFSYDEPLRFPHPDTSASIYRILPYYTTHVSQSRRTSVQCLPNGEFVGRTKPVFRRGSGVASRCSED